MSSDKRRKARIQGGWASTPSNSRSDRDKPQVTASPAWLGKNVDVYKTHNPSQTQSQPSNPLAPASQASGESSKPFVFQKPDKEITPEAQVRVIDKAGVYDLSTEPSGVSRIRYFPHFIEPEDCEWMYDKLFHELPWKQRSDYVNSEKERVQPRLTAWFGEHPYAYSGQLLDAYTEWTPLLQQLKARLEENTGLMFNSVLGNLYRDGHDSVGWHTDDEAGLGPQPTIASLSFGDLRTFEMRKMPPKVEVNSKKILVYAKLEIIFWNDTRCCECRPSTVLARKFVRVRKSMPKIFALSSGPHGPLVTEYVKLSLDPGSLLIMEGATQDDWQHRVPREYHDRGPRINLTFRVIYPVD